MKDIFNAPIKHDRSRKTYFYAEDGYVIISFQRTRSSSGIQPMLEMDVTADMLPA